MVLTLRLRAASHTRAAARGGRRAPPLSTRACPQKSKTLILVVYDLLSATSSSGRPLINRCQRRRRTRDIRLLIVLVFVVQSNIHQNDNTRCCYACVPSPRPRGQRIQHRNTCIYNALLLPQRCATTAARPPSSAQGHAEQSPRSRRAGCHKTPQTPSRIFSDLL